MTNIKKTIDLFGNDIAFEEEAHIYKYKNVEFTSVTTVLKNYFPFDSLKVATELSKNPRNKKYFGLNPKDIIKSWFAKADFGTACHKFAEDYLNGEFVSIQNQREQTIFKYLQRLDFEEVLTEVKVCAPEWKIAGTIDCLIKIKGKWYIYDWKTDSGIYKTGFEKCTGVLASFDNCNYNKFSFQLGIYKLILEHVYDIDIAGIKVVHFNDNKTEEYNLPYHTEYIGLVIKNFI